MANFGSVSLGRDGAYHIYTLPDGGGDVLYVKLTGGTVWEADLPADKRVILTRTSGIVWMQMGDTGGSGHDAFPADTSVDTTWLPLYSGFEVRDQEQRRLCLYSEEDTVVDVVCYDGYGLDLA